MPSIQDVADQINAKLDQINQNTADTVTAAGEIKAELVQANHQLSVVDHDLQVGFANLSQGLFALSELQRLSIALQDHNRKQNDTITCLLENSNELLCGMTRKLTRQLELSEAMLASARRLEGISERANAGEAADYDRHAVLKAQIEECCPPDRPEPEPCPDACDKPGYRANPPKGQDWTPLPPPKGPQRGASG
ncbi:MAG: hypothetical protein HQ481_08475 [Alphaproteobacteria bacterium]|nr:hypothetical protein [Alphaproteobacteria bacterium]